MVFLQGLKRMLENAVVATGAQYFQQFLKGRCLVTADPQQMRRRVEVERRPRPSGMDCGLGCGGHGVLLSRLSRRVFGRRSLSTRPDFTVSENFRMPATPL